MRLGTIRRSLVTGAAAVALLAGGLSAAPASAAPAATTISNEKPFLSVSLIPQADTASLADGVDTYRVVITNHRSVEVKQVTVSVPFAAGYSVAGATFERSGAWVAQIGQASVDLRVEQMRGNGDTVTGTLRLVSNGPAPSNALLGRATVTWRGDSQGSRNLSNLPVASIGGTIADSAPLANGNRAYSFRAAAFASGEPVNLWYTNSAGVSTPLVVEADVIFPQPAKRLSDTDHPTYGTSINANGQGELLARLDIATLAPGTYTLAGRGGWSGTIASATFTVR